MNSAWAMAAVSQSRLGVVWRDAQGRVLAANAAFCRMTACPSAALLGRPLGLWTPQGAAREAGRTAPAPSRVGPPASVWGAVALEEGLRRRGHWSGELWLQRRQGPWMPAWVSAVRLEGHEALVSAGEGPWPKAKPSDPWPKAKPADPGPQAKPGAPASAEAWPQPGGDVLWLAPASMWSPLQAHWHHLAHHDALTGLPNRLLFGHSLSGALERCRREGQALSVVYLDLDGFKAVNDRWGHAAGDALLCHVATALKGAVRASDAVARLSGDEFALLLAELGPGPALQALCEKLQRALQAPLWWEGLPLRARASLGVVSFPRDGVSAEALLRAADAAMYREKRRRAAFFLSAPSAPPAPSPFHSPSSETHHEASHYKPPPAHPIAPPPRLEGQA
jgi:diguanylate cyclase (GGDEF)-like protein